MARSGSTLAIPTPLVGVEGGWAAERRAWQKKALSTGFREPPKGLKRKDLVGIPWRVAFALQADGWWLRSDITWEKTNAMPESVQDRTFRSHEYLFLLAKSEHYYYDADAIKEPVTGNAHSRGNGLHPKCADPDSGIRANTSWSAAVNDLVDTRHKRTVWRTRVSRYPEAHFATFPPELVEPCVLAGAPEGGVVLDPFVGSGTAGAVSVRHGREFVGIDISQEYLELARRRIAEVIESAGELDAETADEVGGGQIGLFVSAGDES